MGILISGMLQGVYVLTDNAFRPLARMSMASPAEAVARAQPVCGAFLDVELMDIVLIRCYSFFGSHAVSLGAHWLAWGSMLRCKRRQMTCRGRCSRLEPSQQSNEREKWVLKVKSDKFTVSGIGGILQSDGSKTSEHRQGIIFIL